MTGSDVTHFRLEAGDGDDQDVVFEGPGDVAVTIADTTAQDVVISNARTAHIMVTGSHVASLRVSSVDLLDLQLIACRINGELDVRNVASAHGPGSILMEEVTIDGELRLESATLVSLDVAHCNFGANLWIRRVTLLPATPVVLSSCVFEQRVWITGGFKVAPEAGSGSRLRKGTPFLDLRQNEFRAAAAISLELSAPDEGTATTSLRGSVWSGGTRLQANCGDGVIDLRDIRVDGRSGIRLEGGGAARASLARAEFLSGADLRVEGLSLDASGSAFRAGGRIASDSAVDCSDATFGQTTLIRANDLGGSTASAPVILSLQRADVTNLTLQRVDLRRCRFAGAIGLDSAIIETPADLWCRRRHRRSIADEDGLRVTRIGTGPAWEAAARPKAAVVAAAYRQLRKGRESTKDEPGAADFYYGEMDMRRLGAARWSLERFLLSAYWAMSGYGLRAWRALISLVAVVVVGGIALAHGGLERTGSLWMGLLSSTEIATLRSTTEKLTTDGRVLAVPLRILAPLIFVQLVLALRSQVRR